MLVHMTHKSEIGKFFFYLFFHVMKSASDLPSSKAPEAKTVLNPGSTNPNSNLKFISPYNVVDNSTTVNVKPNAASTTTTTTTNNPSASELTGNIKSNGEVATVTVDLTKFNVPQALEENSKYLEEWGKLLEKTGMYVGMYV